MDERGIYVGFGARWGEQIDERDAAAVMCAEMGRKPGEREEAERMRLEGRSEAEIVEWFFSGEFFRKADAG